MVLNQKPVAYLHTVLQLTNFAIQNVNKMFVHMTDWIWPLTFSILLCLMPDHFTQGKSPEWQRVA